MNNNSQRELLNTELEKSHSQRRPKSLYVEKAERNKSIKYRFLTYIKKQATLDFQKEIIYKNLFTKNKFVKKFIDTLLANKLRLQQISEFHYKMLEDNSVIVGCTEPTYYVTESFDSVDTQSKFTSFLVTIITKLQIVPLIYPEHKFKILWDIVSIMARLYFLYLIPIELAWTKWALLFGTYSNGTTFMMIILLMDFVISLNTAYYESGYLVKNRLKIIKHTLWRAYAFEWISIFSILILDITTKVIGRDLNVNQDVYMIFLLIFLVHLKNVHDKASEYELALNFSKITSIYLELIKFILLIFYGIHIFACIWFWAGEYSLEHFSESWFTNDNELWQEQYLTSFYYACVTMFSVGYGDITPKSNLEKMVSIILIMVSSMQLSYSINTLGNIIQKISFYSEEKKNNFSIINQYMARKSIPYAFQLQIRDYLTKYWTSKNQENSTEENQIISQLSNDLQEKLLVQSNSALITQIPFLTKNFSLEFQQMLLKKVQVTHLEPEKLFQTEDQLIGYVEEGEIQILHSNLNKGYQRNIQKGQSFGLQKFINGLKSNEKYKSLTFSKILYVLKKDFNQILREFPNDHELFCSFRDKQIFQNPSLFQTEYCQSCNSTQHIIEECPQLHYIPSKEFLIKKYTFNELQKRKFYKRRSRKKIRQLTEDQINSLHYQYSEELKLYNVPQIQKDLDEFSSMPRFKICQSVFPQQLQKMQQAYLAEQFAGIQKQQSLVASTQPRSMNKHPSFISNFIPKISAEIQEQQNIINIEEELKSRVLYLKCYKDEFKHFLDDLELLLKKCQIQTEYKQDTMIFDSIHSFKQYNPQFNIECIMIKLKSSIQRRNFLKQYIKKFIKYLSFPADFFEKYSYYQLKKQTYQSVVFGQNIMIEEE